MKAKSDYSPSDGCPNCGAPLYEEDTGSYREYTCGFATDDTEDWLGRGGCSYAATLRAERDQLCTWRQHWADRAYVLEEALSDLEHWASNYSHTDPVTREIIAKARKVLGYDD